MSFSRRYIILCIIVLTFLVLLITILAQYTESVKDKVHIYTDFNLKTAENSDSPTIITLTLPKNIQQGDAVCIRSVNQEMFVYQNKTLLYEYRKTFSSRWGKSTTNKWHIIPLEHDLAGKDLQFYLYTPYKSLFGYKNFIISASQIEIIEYISLISLPSTIISLISILIGVALILWIALKGLDKMYPQAPYLALFLLFTGIWSYGEARRLFFFLIPPHIDRYIFLLSFFIMPSFFLLFISQNYRHIPKIFFQYLAYCGFFITALAVFLQFFEVFDLLQSIFCIIGIIFVGMLLVLYYTIMRATENKKKISKFYLLLSVCMVALIFLEIYNFLRGEFGNIAFYVRISLVVFSIVAAVSFIRSLNAKDKALELSRKNLAVSQINVVTLKMKPHLIYNTLLSIQELCYSSPKAAVDAIGVFSKYIRTTFDLTTNEKLIPFESELKYIREYIEIQKICYGSEITYLENLEYTTFDIPPLTLQPLIENAVRHGIRQRIANGTIKISTALSDRLISIVIEDDGVGFDTKKINLNVLRTSTGNVFFRLKHLLRAEITVKSILNQGTQIYITIPYRKGEKS